MNMVLLLYMVSQIRKVPTTYLDKAVFKGTVIRNEILSILRVLMSIDEYLRVFTSIDEHLRVFYEYLLPVIGTIY